jgi:hypothetical protein
LTISTEIVHKSSKNQSQTNQKSTKNQPTNHRSHRDIPNIKLPEPQINQKSQIKPISQITNQKSQNFRPSQICIAVPPESDLTMIVSDQSKLTDLVFLGLDLVFLGPRPSSSPICFVVTLIGTPKPRLFVARIVERERRHPW